MSLSFLVPAFLAGLIALGIPVAIHLTRRQVKDPLHFPSLMFLRRMPQQASSRRQIHRWPLLLLRALAVVLLVLAFSRPFLAGEEGASALPTTNEREVVILLDRSYSMGVGDRWERAVAAGDGVIAGLASGDRATLIPFDANVEGATESTTDFDVLRAALREVEPGVNVTRYPPALRYAERILTASPMPRREIVVISDFQRSAWDSDSGEISALRLPAGTVVTPLYIAESAPRPNVTITGADYERDSAADRDRVTIIGRLAATGEADEVPVTLEVDGRVVETRPVAFAGGTAAVAFNPLTLPPEGDLTVTLRTPEDALAGDNEFRMVISGGRGLGVLVVQGPGVRTAGSVYLDRALAIGAAPGFRPTVRRSAELRAADLEDKAVVILDQAPFPEGAIGERIRERVEAGGGLIMILGDNAPGEWPGVPASLPPALDVRDTGGVAIGYVDTGHPVFDAFAGPRTGDFGAARIYRYRPLAHDAFQRILARFGDGGVALAESPAGNGRVLVWTTTLDGSWNDLALQPVFLPFVQQMVKYAAGYAPHRGWMTVGEPFDQMTALPAGEWYDMAVTPSGAQLSLEHATPLELRERGFYQLRNQDEDRSYRFAVNLDPAEADLAAFDPAEMTSALTAGAINDPAATAEAGLTLVELERRQSGWWYLVIAVFLLLIAESLFSNRGMRGPATSTLTSTSTTRQNGSGRRRRTAA